MPPTGGVPAIAAYVPVSPLQQFVAAQDVGARKSIAGDDGNVLYVAVIESDYNAASGRRCKAVRFAEVSAGRKGDGAARQFNRVACFEGGSWRFTEPLLDDGGPTGAKLN